MIEAPVVVAGEHRKLAGRATLDVVSPATGGRVAVMAQANAVATYWQPHTPFGGYSGRSSGVGRLGGRYTIDALSQLQTFVIPRRRLP